jgi:DNA-binding transcriptional ArsR family regulator
MQQLDGVFAALSDPTRRSILARLAKGEATVMELAEPFDMTQPAVSRHLKVLETAGLILRRAEGTTRPCRLAAGGIDTIEQWLAMLHKALTRNYERLDAILAADKSAKRRSKR